MERFINIDRVVAVQMTTPEDNPLVTDASRIMDVWFDGPAIRKQLFKKVSRTEQEQFAANLLKRGFVQSGNLLINPRAVLFAEMENHLLGGVITIGFGDNNRPVELKVKGQAFSDLAAKLAEG
ncbi:hypothetical protein KVP06_00445 [Geobacter sulfurreducens]|jgi:hypothetical protein|uniref:Uncharacterized protein n=1 Tax=Geobacter sulfurreducens (strain ATCC 51573 / DSM 12127 / PCA) TaxID=243231 RepID=I7F9D6_GEOSL|nr:hypothetical protein [Geobacter sulfurreducens]ADI82924.1 hypothetical protein KN400_0061 [Geobacter sulfurreducens KN400]AFP20379.1 hypothetical protein GSU3474 [Geobacter sulfurreducens PCA]AJY69816.1 hypothetical protein RW64_09560 [Geobacter sulfurreducens]UAC04190.1 hypothetical protein KVP06_00445 [Geobacter sulfurreducens]UTG92807.1 hypothetical protein J8622_00325 [Geobacter sulfurreducens]